MSRGIMPIQKVRVLAGREFVECHYCGMRLTFQSMTLDHVVPYMVCRHNKISNLVPACRDCNQRKGCDSYREFVRKIDPNCSYLRSAA